MADGSFPEIARIDARAKVTGAPIYAADRRSETPMHAVFAVSTIAKGRLTRLDVARAEAVPGVRLVLTHRGTGALEQGGFLLSGGFAFQSFMPLMSDVIAYRGQPIAMVVADTLESAMHAASLVDATYSQEAFASSIASVDAAIIAQAESPLPQQLFGDTVAGDAVAAFEAAAVTIDAAYRSPPQHQNPMELVATFAEWDGDDLIIHEGTQNAGALKFGVAQILGIAPERVTVISPQAGGGFGQKNSLQMQTAFVAWAARKLGAPVKMVVPRYQLFGNASFRPESSHRVRLGADAAGRLTSVLYDVDAQSSRHDLFPLDYANAAARLYGIPNFRGHQRIVQTDVQTPGYMRAPFEHLAAFALDTAVDEMAERLGRDPVEYRMAHDTDTDPVTGLPLSSRFLNACLSRGAEMFGWSARTPEPGSMRSADGQLIGFGVGCGCYKAATAAAIATLTLTDDGRVSVPVGVHEMGQGIRTALANAVGQTLGIEPTRVDAVIGDTRGAPQHLTAGSWGTATAVPAAVEAAEKLLEELGADPLAALAERGLDSYEVRVERRPAGQPEQMAGALHQGRPAPWGPVYDEFVAYSYVAHFVEVRIEPTTRRIRVPRVVSVVDCGSVVSPRTATSQVRGGVAWGIGAALREASEVDPRYGGFLNADIAEYVVPVSADIGRTEVAFIDRPDPRLNASGLKGLGEVVMTGVAAAIANATWHATGRRLRDLPIRVEHLL
ncbi:MAG: xanthine dehydrogenase family protein molybdopterin-binding subunit [Aurantimonas endophytica]|uniref:xanthine dehydrogenase family protein molybdopterin-binding subunit n=1 Tax=Aurantimonas endophytica TaxID=1522175 RepID=UPI003003A244